VAEGLERQQPAPLLRREPVAQADAEPAHALQPSNLGRQFGTEQAGICRFVRRARDNGRVSTSMTAGRVALAGWAAFAVVGSLGCATAASRPW
jgi:hypothetical protein